MDAESLLITSLNADIEEDLDSGLDFRNLSVSGLDFSAETLARQILEENIDLSPNYQRRDAWNDEKRSRFLESLILHVPIPQVVLAEDQQRRGRYYVLDGRQRLMTLAGLYDANYRKWKKASFQKLVARADLNGVDLEAFGSEVAYADDFISLRNAPIRCSVLGAYTGDEVLYDIFFRLNSGSVPLSGQELRQVIKRGPFAEFLLQTTGTPQPIHSVMGVEAPDPRFADCEIILRQLSINMGLLAYAGNMKAFLDGSMEQLNSNWSTLEGVVQREYERINQGIESLGGIIGFGNIGRKLDSKGYGTSLNKAILEVQLYYFSMRPDLLTSVSPENFNAAFTDLCNNPQFFGSIEATTKSLERFRTRFEYFRVMLEILTQHSITDYPNVRRLKNRA